MRRRKSDGCTFSLSCGECFLFSPCGSVNTEILAFGASVVKTEQRNASGTWGNAIAFTLHHYCPYDGSGGLPDFRRYAAHAKHDCEPRRIPATSIVCRKIRPN